jgi:metal-responsive CopG/Arc/MetJ family transcriptional regulator
MPTKKPIVQVVLDEESLKKLDEIATNEGRTRSNIAAYIIKKYIEDYEAAKSKESLISQNIESKHKIS